MNIKAKIGIAVILILVVVSAAFVVFQPKEEAPNDIAPPLVMVNDQLYWVRFEKAVDPPEESEIAGLLLGYVEPNRAPAQNGETNQLCCVNQPYAFVDGSLIVRSVNTQASGASPYRSTDRWLYCEPCK